MKCPNCGKFLEQGKTWDGKVVALDPAPPVYQIKKDHENEMMEIERNPMAHVDHRFTCHGTS